MDHRRQLRIEAMDIDVPLESLVKLIFCFAARSAVWDKVTEKFTEEYEFTDRQSLWFSFTSGANEYRGDKEAGWDLLLTLRYPNA